MGSVKGNRGKIPPKAVFSRAGIKKRLPFPAAIFHQQLYMIFLSIFLIVTVKIVGAQLLQIDDIAMGIEAVRLQLNDGNGNVGAVIRYPFIVGKQIVEDEALI